MSINFHIKTKNIDLTPEITSQVHDKIGTVEKFIDISGDKEVLAEVEVGLRSKHHKKGNVYRTEVNLTYNGKFSRAVVKAGSVEESLDKLKDEITRQVRRDKNKKENMFVKGGRQIKRMLKLQK